MEWKQERGLRRSISTYPLFNAVKNSKLPNGFPSHFVLCLSTLHLLLTLLHWPLPAGLNGNVKNNIFISSCDI